MGRTGQSGPGDPMCGSGGGGAHQPWELPSNDKENPGLNPAEAELVRRRAAQDIAQHAAKHPGSVPADLVRWAETELAPPKISWQQLLQAGLRAAISYRMGMVDYSYMRPPRRRVPGVVMPSMRRPIPKVAVGVDTSGSMGKDDLDAAMAEVDGILRGAGLGPGEVTILSVDTEAHTAQRVSSAKQIELRGGGGTDMGEAIAACERLSPRPDIIVILTDGYTPWPAEKSKCQVIIGIIADDPEQVMSQYQPPEWAKVIPIPKGEIEHSGVGR